MSARLTAAQATVKFLEESILCARRQGISIFCRMPGNLRTRKCCGNRASAGAGSGLRYYLFRNEQGDGSRGLGICENKFPDEDAGLHNFDWPGRNKYGDGSGGGHGEPLARFIAARRCFCAAKCRARTATTGISDDAGYFCERLFQARFALLGPNRAPGAIADFSSRGDARVDFSCGHRCGDYQFSPGCAGGSFRFSRRILQRTSLGDPTSTLRSESFEPGGGVGSRRRRSR